MKDLKSKVEKALEEIRPYLISDGGDVELVEISDQEVKVRLLGNCESCAINKSTMKLGIETTIKTHVPEITSVVQVI